MATIFTFHTGKAVVQIAAIEIAIESQAVPVPVEKLDHAAATVDEDEQGTGEGIRPQIGTDNAAQAVK